jgi:hypothetical protein
MKTLVLLIDDSAAVREVLSVALLSDGYRVIEAANGRDGVALFREHRPAVTIVDIVMPEKDGIETVHEILAIDPRRGRVHDVGRGRRLPGGGQDAGGEAGVQEAGEYSGTSCCRQRATVSVIEDTRAARRAGRLGKWFRGGDVRRACPGWAPRIYFNYVGKHRLDTWRRRMGRPEGTRIGPQRRPETRPPNGLRRRGSLRTRRKMTQLPEDVQAEVEYLRFAFMVFGILVRWEAQHGKGTPCPTRTLAEEVATAETLAAAGPAPTAEDLDGIVELLFRKMAREGLLAFRGSGGEAISLTDKGRQEWMNARDEYESQRRTGQRSGQPAFDPRTRGGCLSMLMLAMLAALASALAWK